MMTPEERALLTALQDRMIELLVKKEEAYSRQDAAEAAKLQATVERLKRECDLLRETE
jgi:hypothetical protein